MADTEYNFIVAVNGYPKAYGQSFYSALAILKQNIYVSERDRQRLIDGFNAGERDFDVHYGFAHGAIYQVEGK